MSEPPSHTSSDTGDAGKQPRDPWAAGSSEEPAQGIDPYGDQPAPDSYAASGRQWGTPWISPGSGVRDEKSGPPHETDRQASRGNVQAGDGRPQGDADRQSEQGREPASIDAYQVRSRRWPVVLVTAVAVVIAAVLIVLATRPQNAEPAQSASSPAATSRSTPTSSSAASATPSVPNSIPISTSDFEGTWTIDATTWDSAGVTVQMTLIGTSGSLDYSFFSLDNTSADQYRATGTMAEGTIAAGQTKHGELRLSKPRGDTTLILADGAGRQITALLVQG